MNRQKSFYRRHLPHYQPIEATFHVVARLAGSLPTQVVEQLREEREQLERGSESIRNTTELQQKRRGIREKYFERFEDLLNGTSSGPSWLRQPEIATIVQSALHYYDRLKYDLLAYCVMANHVHVIFVCRVSRPDSAENGLKVTDDLDRSDAKRSVEGAGVDQNLDGTGVPSYIVTNILGSLKKYTARRANKLLKRSGAFWQDESFDHVVQDETELERTIQYVLNNPVKAGFVGSWEQWPWTYVKPGLL